VDQFTIDAGGNLTWQFDPSAPQPYEIAYSADGGQTWPNVLNTGAPPSGSVSLAGLTPGVNYIFVMHAGGNEIARLYYTPGAVASATPILSSSDQGTAVSTSTVPASVTSAVNWFTDPAQELLSGIPNWGTVGGAALAGWLLFFKKKR